MASVLSIPLRPSVPFQECLVTLDGRGFRVRLSWNSRLARWLFDLETASGVALMSGKGLVLGVDPLRQIRALPSAPPGVLVLVDTRDEGVEASLDSLGVRHRFWYLSE